MSSYGVSYRYFWHVNRNSILSTIYFRVMRGCTYMYVVPSVPQVVAVSCSTCIFVVEVEVWHALGSVGHHYVCVHGDTGIPRFRWCRERRLVINLFTGNASIGYIWSLLIYSTL